MGSRGVRDRAGQAAIELALIMPVLLLIALGIVEFGRAFNAKQAVTDATREGARHAVVNDPAITQDSVVGAITTALERAGLSADDATITFDKAAGWRAVSQMQTVTVGVPYRFAFFGPVIKAATGSETITIAARVSMRNQP